MAVDDAWPGFLEAISKAKRSDHIFDALLVLVRDHVGTRLLTASAYDFASSRSRRIYSENAAAYPVDGMKPVSPGKWYDTVLVRHEIFSSTTIEEIAEVFFDWELIRSLGCESNLNLPIVVGGAVIGTMNLLDRAGHYTSERVERARQLAPFATLAFLAAAALPAPKES